MAELPRSAEPLSGYVEGRYDGEIMSDGPGTSTGHISGLFEGQVMPPPPPPLTPPASTKQNPSSVPKAAAKSVKGGRTVYPKSAAWKKAHPSAAEALQQRLAKGKKKNGNGFWKVWKEEELQSQKKKSLVESKKTSKNHKKMKEKVGADQWAGVYYKEA